MHSNGNVVQRSSVALPVGSITEAAPASVKSQGCLIAPVTKYQRWYEALCVQVRGRSIPACYTEVHHIQPRSLGGSDDETNLVRLTYREHYICHWLLTKFHTGANLSKMQKALWAMTLKASGERVTTAWQFETAKRAIRDLELEADDAAYLERWRAKRLREAEVASSASIKSEREYNAKEFLNTLWFTSDQPEPLRSEMRALILKKYSAMHRSEFDHQLIAEYFDAPEEVLQDRYRFLLLGKRRYTASKFRNAS